MKKILFVCSHLHSGSSVLFDSLNCHPRIQGYKLAQIGSYSSPFNLLALNEQRHKLDNRSAIYMDELLFNHNLSTKAAYKECKFIYILREPKEVLNLLVYKNNMKPSFAVRYYTYRIRRLCEMSKRTPGAVLLTWNDLLENKGLSLIEDYLNLKQPISFNCFDFNKLEKKFSNDLVDFKTRSRTEDSYQKYLFFLKNQNLRYCN